MNKYRYKTDKKAHISPDYLLYRPKYKDVKGSYFDILKIAILKNIREKTVNQVMKLYKYFLVPWFSLAIYTFLSIYNGPAGIVSYRELMAERYKILENLDKLHTINRELEGTMDALLYDAETIQVKARELGYGENEERFIRIVGLPGGRPSELKPGMIRTAIIPAAFGKSYRLISICLGLILFSAFIALDVLLKPVKP